MFQCLASCLLVRSHTSVRSASMAVCRLGFFPRWLPLQEDLGPPAGNITSSKAGSLVAAPSIRPGTILVREHQNLLHRVIALETGFSWNGRTFASLSAAARAITGVRWNGRRFFGLQEKRLARLPKSSKEQEKVAP